MAAASGLADVGRGADAAGAAGLHFYDGRVAESRGSGSAARADAGGGRVVQRDV